MNLRQSDSCHAAKTAVSEVQAEYSYNATKAYAGKSLLASPAV